MDLNTALVTGMNGTVAPIVAHALRREGHDVAGWDRNAVSETNPEASLRYLDECWPGIVFHIGMGPPEWAALMARWCHDNERRFVFTSTVSVFSGNSDKPYTVDDLPDATDEYGRYKLACEKAILAANDSALIVRLGWQIGNAPGSNNMVDFIEQNAVDGVIDLSRNFRPGCSFLVNTADALLDLASRDERGLFHLDGNPGLSLSEIGTRLSQIAR